MNDIKNDINLKEAVSRREQQLPPMPEGLNEKVRKSLSRPLPRRGERTEGVSSLSLWRGRGVRLLALAACVAGFVVIFLAPPKSTEEQLPLALEEPAVNSQQPTAKSQEPKAKVAIERERNQTGLSSSEREQARTKFNSLQPKANSQQPVELAEAEAVEAAPVEIVCQEVLDNMRGTSSTYATQAQEIRQRGEQVTQYVAMLNQQIKAEQQYVEY